MFAAVVVDVVAVVNVVVIYAATEAMMLVPFDADAVAAGRRCCHCCHDSHSSNAVVEVIIVTVAVVNIAVTLVTVSHHSCCCSC